MTGLPLEKVRVISLTEVYAGPYATSLLGDMGAEVIHVEAIQRVAQGRGQLNPVPGGQGNYADNDPGTRPWERSAGFNYNHRNKKGITLNLTDPKGIAVFKELVQLSDIMVDNYASGTMERMGIGYEVVSKWNPAIIMLSSSGWGGDGPYKGYISYGSHVDATIGHTYLRGYPDLDPSRTTSIVHSDSITGPAVVFGAMTALKYRMRTGKGQFVDLAQAEAFMPHLGNFIMDYTMNGRVAQPVGNRDHTMAPHGVYRCAGNDRWATIAVRNDEEWRALCKAIGRPELAGDERYADVISRLQRQDELDQIIREWTVDKDSHDVMNHLQKAGVPAGLVMKDDDVWHDPHLRARNFFQMVTHREAGTHEYTKSPWRLDGKPLEIRLPATCLGEYNYEVYRELLGKTAEEYQQMEDEKLIGDTYVEGAEVSPRDRDVT
ncbi:MAG: CoA transferase [Dehalococcoidia bacterium]|nr:CoA transferase [Dehalococcoidia bacterium]